MEDTHSLRESDTPKAIATLNKAYLFMLKKEPEAEDCVHGRWAALSSPGDQAEAGLSARVCCHTFRATGITAYLENGGTLEHAQAIAAHESPRTTKLYDRTSDQITLDEVERIQI